jgi:hypothetical protein
MYYTLNENILKTCFRGRSRRIKSAFSFAFLGVFARDVDHLPMKPRSEKNGKRKF